MVWVESPQLRKNDPILIDLPFVGSAQCVRIVEPRLYGFFNVPLTLGAVDGAHPDPIAQILEVLHAHLAVLKRNRVLYERRLCHGELGSRPVGTGRKTLEITIDAVLNILLQIRNIRRAGFWLVPPLLPPTLCSLAGIWFLRELPRSPNGLESSAFRTVLL